MLNDERFWEQVAMAEEADCWIWQGPQWGGEEGDRYGQYTDGRWNYYAHRFAYAVKVGPIPVNGRVLHTCDRRLCCNPKHLFLGTQKDNIADMMAKGRGHKASGEEHGMRKLTKEQVLEIFVDPRPQKEIAAVYGVGLTCISNIKTGFTWSHITGKQRVA